MVVNVEAGGVGEAVQETAESVDAGDVPFERDERVIGVLKDRAGEGDINWVADDALRGGFLEDIGNDYEQVGGDWVALAEAAAHWKGVKGRHGGELPFCQCRGCGGSNCTKCHQSP